ncbi:MAG: (2Fe-2S) ferredoxin domain-containing protein [Anaerolineae bacterium]|nr:(2Fe-2S) ferredoxin domain-containing protein [Anaerolineae bacterium]
MDAGSEKPKRKRVVLCMGAYCNMDRRAKKLYPRLQALVDELNGDTYPPPIKLEIATCLSMCGAGPNLMIYPEALAFNDLDEATLERIVKDHLAQE